MTSKNLLVKGKNIKSPSLGLGFSFTSSCNPTYLSHIFLEITKFTSSLISKPNLEYKSPCPSKPSVPSI